MYRAKGVYFEVAAEHYLNSRGLRTVRRNFSCKLGEIDLIMEDGEFLAFVEVRYRDSIKFGAPLETITPRKQQRIIRAASIFLQRESRFSAHPCRFDAIGITGSNDSLVFDWIKSAFSA
jgi:putative endonuclease